MLHILASRDKLGSWRRFKCDANRINKIIQKVQELRNDRNMIDKSSGERHADFKLSFKQMVRENLSNFIIPRIFFGLQAGGIDSTF